MSFEKIQREDRRFHILLFLSKEPDFALNNSMLHQALKVIGHGVDPDLVITDMSWLKDQGLIKITEQGSFSIAKLTNRGLAVANQDVVHPGISRTIMDD